MFWGYTIKLFIVFEFERELLLANEPNEPNKQEEGWTPQPTSIFGKGKNLLPLRTNPPYLCCPAPNQILGLI